MWLFCPKRQLVRHLLDGFSDCHSHILPGVDDGVQTMEESLAILHCYEDLGIKSVWLTPHIMEDIPNTTAALRRKYNELLSAYKGTMTLHLSAEYMLDNMFRERLKLRDLLPLGRLGKHLLVETSYFNPPMDLDKILSVVKEREYIPVLAHPERYCYMDYDEYSRLKSVGIKFQLNLFSLVGAYGIDALKKAAYLLEKGLYDCVGMDIHSLPSFEKRLEERIRDKKTFSSIQEIIKKQDIYTEL